jgi:hypothetical protein
MKIERKIFKDGSLTQLQNISLNISQVRTDIPKKSVHLFLGFYLWYK